MQVYTAAHPMNAELMRKQEFSKTIEIGSDVSVGGRAIISPGVRIGSRSVIGGGSVVTRDIPEGVFAAGNPCPVVREIPPNRFCLALFWYVCYGMAVSDRTNVHSDWRPLAFQWPGRGPSAIPGRQSFGDAHFFGRAGDAKHRKVN